MPTGPATRHVLIAGGGVAGIEAALALRAFAGDALRVTVVDPVRRFTVPATATGQAFGLGGWVEMRLADAVDRAGARLVSGRLRSVEPRRHLATLAGGRIIRYDALIVAVGAVAVTAVPGALAFTGLRDVDAVRDLVDDVVLRARRGAEVELAMVVPPGCGWPLPAYELGLMAREHLDQFGAGSALVRVVTAERAPLDIFGREAGAAVTGTLARAGVPLHTGAAVVGWDSGLLALDDGSAIRVDRAIALPVYRGPAVMGLPADALGFIPTGADGAVDGVADVWAVGDGTTLPIKQGGVACRQADLAAGAVAGALGVGAADAGSWEGPTGWLRDGERARALPPAGDGPPRAWPVAKIDGRFLTPFLRAAAAGGVPPDPATAPD